MYFFFLLQCRGHEVILKKKDNFKFVKFIIKNCNIFFNLHNYFRDKNN